MRSRLAHSDLNIALFNLTERIAAEEREAAEKEAKRQAAREEAESRRAKAEAERAADLAKIQAQLKREEEAMARRAAAKTQAPVPVRAAPLASAAPSGERQRLALQPRNVAAPPTASTVGVTARTDGAASPAATVAAAAATGKFMPPSLRAAAGASAPGGSWRDREAARKAAGGDASPAAAPTSPAIPESKPSSYRPPGASGGSGWRDREAASGDRPKNAWAPKRS